MPRMFPKVNHGPLVIMMGQCRFTDCDQCITLERDADGGRGCAHEEAGGMELSGF